MPEEVLSFLVAIAILAMLALWIPTLILCQGCYKRMLQNTPQPTAERDRAFLESDSARFRHVTGN